MSDILDTLDEWIRERIPVVRSYSDDQVRAEAVHAGNVIATAADALDDTSQAGQKVLGSIALGVAILARRDGGVIFNGRHYRAKVEGPRLADEWLHEPPTSATGAVYTPQWMADRVTLDCLNAVCAVPGPLEMWDTEQWRCIAPNELIEVRVADIACGSGVFLRSACEYLTCVLARAVAESILGVEPEDLMRWTRKLVLQRCIYGVDIEPWSVELARLSLALLAPFDTVDAHIARNVVAGDSLAHPRSVDGELVAPPGVENGVDFRRWPEVDQQGGFDAIIGNPPFLGGQKITGQLGKPYRDWLIEHVARGATGSADLSAYFLLQAWDLINKAGQLGLITTNTIAQGATKRVGLEQVVDEGGTIWQAVKSAPWPTDRAALEYSAIWITRTPYRGKVRSLDAIPEPETEVAPC